MKIIILNGSPRKGNTVTAINAFVEGAKENNEIEILDTDRLNVSPCKGCGACQCYKGCVATDDSNSVVDKIISADLIVFATPVYWWGMTAQLKTVLDKCYCKGAYIKGKKLGTLIVGGSPVDHKEYRMINEQIECIAEYLNCQILFSKSFYANAKDELSKNQAALAELTALGTALN